MLKELITKILLLLKFKELKDNIICSCKLYWQLSVLSTVTIKCEIIVWFWYFMIYKILFCTKKEECINKFISLSLLSEIIDWIIKHFGSIVV